MKRIAIYGKGGIGKSTISSNLSYTWSQEGKKVLHMGCDPKHDSTRSLLKDKKIQSVLEYLNCNNRDNLDLSEVLIKGRGGVHCIEAGGPKAGLGCAGLGIKLTFQTLEEMGLSFFEYDMVLYDVLGDVVCGGFSIPLREDYSDAVYIVTSGEFMSLYAANNILSGIETYQEKNRCGGLIANLAGIENEIEILEKYSKAIELPIVGLIPRDNLFSKSEREGVTLVEKDPDSDVAQIFRDLAYRIFETNEYFKAKPLTEKKLLEVFL